MGPSRCSLCGDNEENASHLMLRCNFTAKLWKEALSPWSVDFTLPNRCSDLFSNWKLRYPGGTPQNAHIKEAWLALPKLICWHIWLEEHEVAERSTYNPARLSNAQGSDPIPECQVSCCSLELCLLRGTGRWRNLWKGSEAPLALPNSANHHSPSVICPTQF